MDNFFYDLVNDSFQGYANANLALEIRGNSSPFHFPSTSDLGIRTSENYQRGLFLLVR